MSRFSPCVHISDSPYSGVGHSDRLLICGDYVPTGIPAWETIKNNKEEIKMISKEKKTDIERYRALIEKLGLRK